MPTPTEFDVHDPQDFFSPGMLVIVEGYLLVVDPSGLSIDGDFIGFSIQVKVLGEKNRLFRYNASSLSLKDDLGNQYDFNYNMGLNICTESDIYPANQIMIKPHNEIIIEPHSSMGYASYFWWCLEDHN